MGYFLDVLIPTTAQYFREHIVPRFLEMVSVPSRQKEALWAIIPLLVTLFLVQVYFGRHRDEEIGWNTAFGNCIVLIFVTANLMRFLYQKEGIRAILTLGEPAFYRGLMIVVVLLLAVALFFIDFFHSLSKRISFFLSSSVFITFAAFIVVIGVYSDIPLDKDTFITTVLFFIVVWVFFMFFRSTIPPSENAEKFLEEKERERKYKILEKERKIKEELHIIKEKIGGEMENVRSGVKKKVKSFKSVFK